MSEQQRRRSVIDDGLILLREKQHTCPIPAALSRSLPFAVKFLTFFCLCALVEQDFKARRTTAQVAFDNLHD